MDSIEVLEQALRLKPEDRFLVVEGLLKSLDEPDQAVDAILAEEAERRLTAFRALKENHEGLLTEARSNSD